MSLGMLEILKVRGLVGTFFVPSKVATTNANPIDKIAVTTATAVVFLSVSDILGSLNAEPRDS
jgi:hypothetical protein